MGHKSITKEIKWTMRRIGVPAQVIIISIRNAPSSLTPTFIYAKSV
jgi:hypothetical protein